MKSADPFNMRIHWDALLEIYKEFAKICDKHGLRYYFMEGNAIGALRHKGFVPWDDDIDVAMPRPDYERFRAIASKELPAHLRFWDWRDMDDWRFTFGKIQDCREEKVLEVESGIGHVLSSGLYIDILVIDGFPESKIRQMLYKFKVLLYGSAIRYLLTTFKCQTALGKVSWLYGFICSKLMRLGNVRDVQEKIDRLMKSVPFETAKTTWRAGAAIRVTMTFPREVWNGVVMKEFDDIEVPLPVGYDTYLRTQYGGYMTLPPPDKQRPSHCLAYRQPWWMGPCVKK